MQPAGSKLFPMDCHTGRIFGEDCFSVIVALIKADATSALQVDGGNDFYEWTSVTVINGLTGTDPQVSSDTVHPTGKSRQFGVIKVTIDVIVVRVSEKWVY